MNVLAFVRLLRPGQWVKNLLIFFPPFLAGALFHAGVLASGFVPFVTLCLASSCVYVCNDYLDRGQDRLHPRKCQRPVATGEIGLRGVMVIVSFLVLLLIPLALTQSSAEQAFLLGYLLLSLLYAFKLRNVPLVDIFCIAALFLLRLEYGGVVFAVTVSAWLFLSVLFLALFLSAGKRLHERIELATGAPAHRGSLAGYPDGFLDGIMFLTGAA
ncbi:MAG: phosphoribose diphosphate--decaprenyl-phosphate phosphoribosyltransferase, partial [Desulfuromonadales bacterium GWD2_61_12]